MYVCMFDTPASNPGLASPLPSGGDDSSRADTIADSSYVRMVGKEDAGLKGVPSLTGHDSPGAASSPARDNSFLGGGSLTGSFMGSSVAADFSAISSEMDRSRLPRFQEQEDEEILEVSYTVWFEVKCTSGVSCLLGLLFWMVDLLRPLVLYSSCCCCCW